MPRGRNNSGRTAFGRSTTITTNRFRRSNRGSSSGGSSGSGGSGGSSRIKVTKTVFRPGGKRDIYFSDGSIRTTITDKSGKTKTFSTSSVGASAALGLRTLGGKQIVKGAGGKYFYAEDLKREAVRIQEARKEREAGGAPTRAQTDRQKREAKIRADEKAFMRRETQRNAGITQATRDKRISVIEEKQKAAQSVNSKRRFLESGFKSPILFAIRRALDKVTKGKSKEAEKAAAQKYNQIRTKAINKVSGGRFSKAVVSQSVETRAVIKALDNKYQRKVKQEQVKELAKVQPQVDKIQKNIEIQYARLQKQLKTKVNSNSITVNQANTALNAFGGALQQQTNNQLKKIDSQSNQRLNQRLKDSKIEERYTKELNDKLLRKDLTGNTQSTLFATEVFSKLGVKGGLKLIGQDYKKWNIFLDKLAAKKERIGERDLKKATRDVNRIKEKDTALNKFFTKKNLDIVNKSNFPKYQKVLFTQIYKLRNRLKKNLKELRITKRSSKTELASLAVGGLSRTIKKPGRAVTSAVIAGAIAAVSSGIGLSGQALMQKAGIILFTGYGVVQTGRVALAGRNILKASDIIGESIADVGGALVGIAAGKGLVKGVRALTRRTTLTPKSRSSMVTRRLKQSKSIGKQTQRIDESTLRRLYPRRMKGIYNKKGSKITIRGIQRTTTGKYTGKVKNTPLREVSIGRKARGVIDLGKNGYVRLTKVKGGKIQVKYYTRNDFLVSSKSFKTIPDQFSFKLPKGLQAKTQLIKTTLKNGKIKYELVTKTAGKTQRLDYTKLFIEESLLKKVLTPKEIRAVKAGKNVITNEKIIGKLRGSAKLIKKLSFTKGGRDITFEGFDLKTNRLIQRDLATAQSYLKSVDGKVYFRATPGKIYYVIKAKLRGNVVYHLMEKGINGVKPVKTSLKPPKLFSQRYVLATNRQIIRITQSEIKLIKAILSGIKAAALKIKNSRLIGSSRKGQSQLLLNVEKLKPSFAKIQAEKIRVPKPSLEPGTRISFTAAEIGAILDSTALTIPALVGLSITPAILSTLKNKLNLRSIPLRASIALPSSRISTANVSVTQSVPVSITQTTGKSIQQIISDIGQKIPVGELGGLALLPLIPAFIPFGFGGFPRGAFAGRGFKGFEPLVQERFIYLPDLYSKLFGISIPRGSARARELLRPGKVFTNLESRPIIK